MAIEKVIRKTTLDAQDRQDAEFWKKQPPGAGLDVLTQMVNDYLSGLDESARRFQRVYRVVKRPRR